MPCRFRLVGAVQTRMCPTVPVPAKSVKPGKGPKAHIRIICAESGICQVVPAVILIPEKGLARQRKEVLYIIDFSILPLKSWQAVCREGVLTGTRRMRFPEVTAPDWANLEPKHQYRPRKLRTTSLGDTNSAYGKRPANRPGEISTVYEAWPAESQAGRGIWPRYDAPRPGLWPLGSQQSSDRSGASWCPRTR